MGSIPQANEFDVIVIGAGVSGLCTLHHIREQFPDWRVKVLDAAPNVGGTWYWNAYPGCRFDSESLSYAFSFDKELLSEWHWKEAFSAQPDTLRYLKRFAEKHNLYPYIQSNTIVKSARWDGQQSWTLEDGSGSKYTTTFLVSCMGFLSVSTLPAIPGLDNFKGTLFHTSRWPKEIDITRDFASKRVGIIGTGATGIQIITALSKEPSIKSIEVFQRTANWASPLRNSDISAEQMAEIIKSGRYDSVFDICARSTSGFMHLPDPRKSSEVSQEERVELWERLYNAPGMGKWLSVFSDTHTDRTANKLYSNFMANKIRQRVSDPALAEKLIPKDHGFGTRRVPLESGYYEAYNKSHVRLTDLKETPIESITASGIKTSDGVEHALDILICATGFNAITGAFGAIDWLGNDGRPLIVNSSDDPKKAARAIWPDHRPETYLGCTIPDMPNLFMVLGPHQPFGNATRNVEFVVNFITDLLGYCKKGSFRRVEPTGEPVEEWNEHVVECSKPHVLMNEIDSWMTGVNKNVNGKTVRSIARYCGEAKEYRKRCQEVKDSGYKGFRFT
ncbi:hypothetical protein FDECE_1730 [Fusarium decemcellulare]|nr:hypothetical protein FDECE_1730 [Fusarium decemcellulare]